MTIIKQLTKLIEGGIMKRKIWLVLLISAFLIIVPNTQAKTKKIKIQLVDGVVLEIPLPATKPNHVTLPNEDHDVFGIYNQNEIFWKYTFFTKVDLNHDGKPDYYVLVEVEFGPNDFDLSVDATWHKIKLNSEEEAFEKQRATIALGGVEGKDYSPIFYDFARQSVKYYLTPYTIRRIFSDKAFNVGFYLIRKKASGGFEKVGMWHFEEFLKKNCQK